MAENQTSTRAVYALILGILAWTMCPIVGAMGAILVGWQDPSPIARAGRIPGWVQLCVVATGLLLAILIPGLFAFLHSAD